MSRARLRPARAASAAGNRRGALGVASVLLAAVVLVVLSLTRRPATPQATADPVAQASQPRPEPLEIADDLPALHRPTAVMARSPEATRDAYAFAARHPEVLRYVPCFCGCERNGHGSNHDCFVSGRTREGQITWDAHGLG